MLALFIVGAALLYLAIGAAVVGLLERADRSEVSDAAAVIGAVGWPVIVLFVALILPMDAIRSAIRGGRR